MTDLRRRGRGEKGRGSDCCFIPSFLARLIYKNRSATAEGDCMVTRRSSRAKGKIEATAETNIGRPKTI